MCPPFSSLLLPFVQRGGRLVAFICVCVSGCEGRAGCGLGGRQDCAAPWSTVRGGRGCRRPQDLSCSRHKTSTAVFISFDLTRATPQPLDPPMQRGFLARSSLKTVEMDSLTRFLNHFANLPQSSAGLAQLSGPRKLSADFLSLFSLLPCLILSSSFFSPLPNSPTPPQAPFSPFSTIE